MQQTLDKRLIRKPFGSGKPVGDNEVNGNQPDTDMSRRRACEQTTNGAIPLLIRDLGNVAEVDFLSGVAARASSSFFCFLVGITSPFRWTCFSCRDDPDHLIVITGKWASAVTQKRPMVVHLKTGQ
jgi:hypothetical protein